MNERQTTILVIEDSADVQENPAAADYVTRPFCKDEVPQVIRTRLKKAAAFHYTARAAGRRGKVNSCRRTALVLGDLHERHGGDEAARFAGLSAGPRSEPKYLRVSGRIT